jgi:hypothetical protein
VFSVLAGTRRATASQIRDAATAIDQFIVHRPDVHVGEIAQTRWSLIHARQPQGTSLDISDTATFAQAQHIDIMRAREPQASEDVYQTIFVRLNGSSELQLTLNVQELRCVLGLPNHNLLSEGVFPSFVIPEKSSDDMEDVDHLSD